MRAPRDVMIRRADLAQGDIGRSLCPVMITSPRLTLLDGIDERDGAGEVCCAGTTFGSAHGVRYGWVVY